MGDYLRLKKVNFVTGKGGIGKSHFAAALGIALTGLVSPEETVLVISHDPTPALVSSYGLEGGYEQGRIHKVSYANNLEFIELRPNFGEGKNELQDLYRRQRHEYVALEIQRLAADNGIQVSVPGVMRNLALAEYLTGQHGDYDHIIVDTHSTEGLYTLVGLSNAIWQLEGKLRIPVLGGIAKGTVSHLSRKSRGLMTEEALRTAMLNANVLGSLRDKVLYDAKMTSIFLVSRAEEQGPVLEKTQIYIDSLLRGDDPLSFLQEIPYLGESEEEARIRNEAKKERVLPFAGLVLTAFSGISGQEKVFGQYRERLREYEIPVITTPFHEGNGLSREHVELTSRGLVEKILRQ